MNNGVFWVVTPCSSCLTRGTRRNNPEDTIIQMLTCLRNRPVCIIPAVHNFVPTLRYCTTDGDALTNKRQHQNIGQSAETSFCL
jgi:heterodisulfide reductase subunit C